MSSSAKHTTHKSEFYSLFNLSLRSITLVQSYFVYWSRIRSAVVHDGTRSSQITDSVTGQPTVNTTGNYDQHTIYAHSS